MIRKFLMAGVLALGLAPAVSSAQASSCNNGPYMNAGTVFAGWYIDADKPNQGWAVTPQQGRFFLGGFLFEDDGTRTWTVGVMCARSNEYQVTWVVNGITNSEWRVDYEGDLVSCLGGSTLDAAKTASCTTYGKVTMVVAGRSQIRMIIDRPGKPRSSINLSPFYQF